MAKTPDPLVDSFDPEHKCAEGPAVEWAPTVGEVYRDTLLNKDDLAEVLHVGTDHAIVQRKNGVGRYPIVDFGEDRRFQLVPAEQE